MTQAIIVGLLIAAITGFASYLAVQFKRVVKENKEKEKKKLTPTKKKKVAKKKAPKPPAATIKLVDDEAKRILEKAGIPDGVAKTKKAFGEALAKLTKKEIDYLADKTQDIKLDARQTKAKMIESFLAEVR